RSHRPRCVRRAEAVWAKRPRCGGPPGPAPEPRPQRAGPGRFPSGFFTAGELKLTPPSPVLLLEICAMPFAALATWPFGQTAVRTAVPLLRQDRPALDAAVAGAQAVEDDPRVNSVGYGGLPNAVGTVQLDACVMDGRTLGCGAVAGLENVRHP